MSNKKSFPKKIGADMRIFKKGESSTKTVGADLFSTDKKKQRRVKV